MFPSGRSSTAIAPDGVIPRKRRVILEVIIFLLEPKLVFNRHGPASAKAKSPALGPLLTIAGSAHGKSRRRPRLREEPCHVRS